ncbi:MAG: hypothetical protein ACR2OE_02370 [Thermomicrobiales bacterium]
MQAGIGEMRERAARHGRELIYGLRVHVIARPTEDEAKAAADRLISREQQKVGGIRPLSAGAWPAPSLAGTADTRCGTWPPSPR